MKYELLQEISGRLNSLGVPFAAGQGTDISIAQEYLDAKWSTGQKKIVYEAAIFADEAKQTVYFFQLITETGGGFSFGSEATSSTQAGMTQHVHVKANQFGPDGQAYQVDLDLGAIPAAVKAAAKAHSWKFKTVLRRSSAMYPQGFIPSPTLPQQTQPHSAPLPPAAPIAAPSGPAQGAPTQPQMPTMPPPGPPMPPPPHGVNPYPMNPQIRQAPPKLSTSFAAIVAGAVALLSVGLLAILGSSPIGWVVGIAAIAGVFFAVRALPANAGGRIGAIGIAALAAGVVLVAAAMTAPDDSDDEAAGEGATTEPSSEVTDEATEEPPLDAALLNFQFVSPGLTNEFKVQFADAAGLGSDVVAIGYNLPPGGDMALYDGDLFLAHSGDAGATWEWGGRLEIPGGQQPRAVMVVPDGVIVVGNHWDSNNPTRAFIAGATAPDFMPVEIAAPAEFDGEQVTLIDVASAGDTWVILGFARVNGEIQSFVWTTPDGGDTWSKAALDVGGSFIASHLAITDDGAWNILGAYQAPDASVANVGWLRTEDSGASYFAVQPEAFASTVDESPKSVAFGPNGTVAILGFSGTGTALWVSNSDGAMQRMEPPNLPDQGGNPSDLDGIRWIGESLLAWGDPVAYIGNSVQFWAMSANGEWGSTTLLTQQAASIVWIKQVLAGGDTALAFGTIHQSLDNSTASMGVWRSGD